jgi:hypothetical protein
MILPNRSHVSGIRNSPEGGESLDTDNIVKKLFLVDLPQDFYAFWEFCKSLKPNSPSCMFIHVS